MYRNSSGRDLASAQKKAVISEPKPRIFGWLKETLLMLVIALVLHGVFRSFVAEIFHIPTGSMVPTVMVGDHLLVTKYSYGYGKYSSIFKIDLNDRVMASEPKRGDIVIFHSIYDEDKTYIKRLIGLPGDKIMMDGGVLHINGEPVKRTKLGSYNVPFRKDIDQKELNCTKYLETMPDGVRYQVLYDESADPSDFPNTTPEYKVPEGYYFMMGDNRNFSIDSRYRNQMGLIPSTNIQGKARMMLYNGNIFTAILQGRFFREIFINNEK